MADPTPSTPLFDRSDPSMVGRQISGQTAQQLMDTNLYIPYIPAEDALEAELIRAQLAGLPHSRIRPDLYTVDANMSVPIQVDYSDPKGGRSFTLAVLLRPIIGMVNWSSDNDPVLQMALSNQFYVVASAEDSEWATPGKPLHIRSFTRTTPISEVLTVETDVLLVGDDEPKKAVLSPHPTRLRQLRNLRNFIIQTPTLAAPGAPPAQA